MYEHERSLVEQYRNEPFALIGVNSDDSLQRVKQAIKKNELNWRSFYDGSGGPIAKSWNIRGWPSIFLIDHTGKIRYTRDQLGGDRLDKAIAELVAEAKSAQ